jgi:hypothetical protein
MKRRWVYLVQLLLTPTSAAILWSQSHGTHDILLSQTPQLEGQMPVFISPRIGFPFDPSYN